MTERRSRIAVSEEELEQLKNVKETMFGRHASDVPHGTVLSKLCERFERQEAVTAE